MRIREVEKALAVLFIADTKPMQLENLTFFVEVGPPVFSSDDFITRRNVKVNGVDVGHVSVDRVQDDMALLERP